MPPRSVRTALVLTVGTLAVSTAAPFIAKCGMPALTIAAWRTLLCGALYGVASLAWTGGPRVNAGDFARAAPRLALGGALLAAHFALWISAFDHTSYASSVLLLITQPVFGALLGWLVLRERVGGGTIVSLAVAAAGLAMLVRADLGAPSGLLGDALAVAGSLALALYYLVVRPLRGSLPFAPFMCASYGGAGLLLTGICALQGTALTGYGSDDWLWMWALVLVPTVVGHACFNWSVPRVRFFTLNLLIVLEPALALVFGWFLVGERVSGLQALGGATLGAAVLMGVRRTRTSTNGRRGAVTQSGAVSDGGTAERGEKT